MRVLLNAYLLSLLVIAGCQSQPTTLSGSNSNVPVTVSEATETLKAQDVLNALKVAKIPIGKEIVYSPETDPNKLLGRPHQYIGKASWNDKRADKPSSDDRNMTVEIFASSEDLENRRRYVEGVTKVMSPLAVYQFVHKNALLRLNHALTPKDAAEYERILKTL